MLKSKKEMLEDAKFVKEINGYWFVWYGGHGVHIYDERGEEVEFYNIGPFNEEETTLEKVKDSCLPAYKYFILGIDDEEINS